ncbi:MAG: dephospho-CoA kinase [Solirubrobacterales bacterium]|nr:dephospho-CoA kinase [Solirubrobacterales bacterium]
MKFVGLTGGIGAGKSTALGALEELGAATLSTDQVVHDLYKTEEVRDAVLERFGTVDRDELATRAFATEEGRDWLEQLLWPRVGARIVEWRAQLEQAERAPRAAVVEVPLLFEAGMEDAFDATIAVIANEDLRAERAGGRGHQALDERSSRQLSQQEKAGRATYVVQNDGSERELLARLSDILDILER